MLILTGDNQSGLVTQDFQWEFDGLLMGAGTPYGVTAAPGFLDLSGVRANFTPRARAHGGYTEPHFGGGAVLDIEFNLEATSSTTFAAACLALEANTYPQESTRPLRWQVPGHPILTMQVQCIRRAIPLTTDYQAGLSIGCALQFYAPDPLKYAAQMVASTGLPVASGGLGYPIRYPLGWGSSTSGRISAANSGSADTNAVFTVSGPIDAQGFQITSIEDGVTATYNGPLGAADVVVFNPVTGLATLNGADRSTLLTLTSNPFPPIPGTPAGAAVISTRTYAFTTPGTYHASASMAAVWSPAFW